MVSYGKLISVVTTNTLVRTRLVECGAQDSQRYKDTAMHEPNLEDKP